MSSSANSIAYVATGGPSRKEMTWDVGTSFSFWSIPDFKITSVVMDPPAPTADYLVHGNGETIGKRTKAEAMGEAERIAKTVPGTPIGVFKSINVALASTPVSWAVPIAKKAARKKATKPRVKRTSAKRKGRK